VSKIILESKAPIFSIKLESIIETKFYSKTTKHVKINSTPLESILAHPKLEPNIHLENYLQITRTRTTTLLLIYFFFIRVTYPRAPSMDNPVMCGSSGLLVSYHFEATYS
jgi:hypothetical protein